MVEFGQVWAGTVFIFLKVKTDFLTMHYGYLIQA